VKHVKSLNKFRSYDFTTSISISVPVGNPDVPSDWSFLRNYSAYHNIDPTCVAAKGYPPLLMTTSTKDDRVHPYHARAFVKRLCDIEVTGDIKSGLSDICFH